MESPPGAGLLGATFQPKAPCRPYRPSRRTPDTPRCGRSLQTRLKDAAGVDALENLFTAAEFVKTREREAHSSSKASSPTGSQTGSHLRGERDSTRAAWSAVRSGTLDNADRAHTPHHHHHESERERGSSATPERGDSSHSSSLKVRQLEAQLASAEKRLAGDYND